MLVAGTADLLEMARCNVRFDEARMFEFLHALEGNPAVRGVPIVCCRLGPLGVDCFVDAAL